MLSTFLGKRVTFIGNSKYQEMGVTLVVGYTTKYLIIIHPQGWEVDKNNLEENEFYDLSLISPWDRIVWVRPDEVVL